MNRPSATETERGRASETARRKSAKKHGKHRKHEKVIFYNSGNATHHERSQKIKCKKTHGTKQEFSQNRNPVKDEN